MTDSNTAALTDDQWRQWTEAGYLLLRGAIPAATMGAMRTVFEEVVDGFIDRLHADGLATDLHPDAPLETRFAKVAGEHAGRFGRSWRGAITSRALFDLHRAPALVDALTELLPDDDVLGHPVWNARPKLPHQQLTVVPWHQDSGYFGEGSENSRILTAWIPLAPATIETGCLQVLPGSHRQGIMKHVSETREGHFLEVEGINADDAVTCEMQPGDVLLFGNLMLHQSLANLSDIVRWSVDVRYYPASDWMGSIDWPTKDFQWVIRSKDRDETTYESWLEHAGAIG